MKLCMLKFENLRQEKTPDPLLTLSVFCPHIKYNKPLKLLFTAALGFVVELGLLMQCLVDCNT